MIMPRKGLRVLTEVDVQCVTCPGVRLPLGRYAFLRISMMGQLVCTQAVNLVFPLVFREKFKFVKTFPWCSDFQQLDQELKVEEVVLELIDEDRKGGQLCILASYKTIARSFLFPILGLKPCYSSCSDNEIIMTNTNNFPGSLGPKVEFSTLTTVMETCRPELDYLKDKACKLNQHSDL